MGAWARQAVWLALLMHAAIPRSELVLELQDAGRWHPITVGLREAGALSLPGGCFVAGRHSQIEGGAGMLSHRVLCV